MGIRDFRFCDGIARRDFLRLGAAGLFGVGLSLPDLLQRQALAADQGTPTREPIAGADPRQRVCSPPEGWG